MKKLLFVFIACLCLIKTFAQLTPANNSSDIYLQLKKLNVLATVLYVAAHPDDENTRLLAYLSKEKQYRTGYLSLTRGDGGQNLIGDEQGIELGLIRTQELLAARRTDGAEQFFSRAYDFGFSKNASEALRIWNHDKILSDVVWVIRKFQPDVIITRFPGDERAGHGHHSASALLANEAFNIAADTTKFPEQFKYGVKPWQPKRIFWNTFNFGGNNTTGEDQFKIDVGVYNSLLGKSYGEIASDSRSNHKSQGFGVAKQRGEAFEYFKLTGGDSVKNDLLQGVVTTWQRVQGGENVEAQINTVISQFSFEHPENSVAALTDIYRMLKQLPDGYWKNKKLEEVESIIINCSGLFAEATSSNENAVQGDSVKVQFFINKRNNINIALKKIQFPSFDSSLQFSLKTNQNFIVVKTFNVAVNEPVSQPYWLAKPLQSGSFDVTDQQLIGKPENDPAYAAIFVFTINGEDFTVKRALQFKYTDPVKGEVYQPLRVVPAATAQMGQPVYIVTGKNSKQVEAGIIAKKDFTKVSAHIATTDGWKITNGEINDSLSQGNSKEIRGVLTPSNNANNAAELTVVADNITDTKGNIYNSPLMFERRINYEHIPSIIYYKPLEAKLEKIDVITKGKSIGYIIGAGDKVPQALLQLGYSIKFLNEAEITLENLQQFDAIITGVRAYNVHEWLAAKYYVLMNYIKNGGNLIVQYNTNSFAGPIKTKIGPYDFNISRTRITDENATINMLVKEHPVFNYPNKITEKDFEGWVQERSIYHAENLDAHYIAPIGLHDPNEAESNGSLIIAKYGKGNFVYTGLVFFRELPAGVPGAYRLMANLIALPKNSAAKNE